jgi:FkbM family methyltransferase
MEKIKRTFGFILNHPLGKRHPFKAFFRFLIWQLQSGISSKPIIKSFIPPVKFYARKGLTGITGNIYTGLHEFNDMCFLLHFLKPEDIFYDIGANVGSYTLLASGVCKAKSFTIEPVISTFNLLKENIQLNKLDERVSLINSGAGAKTGVLNFTSDEDTTNHVIAAEDISGKSVISLPIITIDSLLDSGQPALIKIDVEGFETEVLKGMVHTLQSSSLKAIIIELNGSGLRYGYNENDIHHLLLSKSFKPFSYDPFIRSLTDELSFGSHNTIYCRDLGFVSDRVKNAKNINIMGELI